MVAGCDDRVVVELLADFAAQGSFERFEGGQRRFDPVGGVREIEGRVHGSFGDRNHWR